MEGYGGIMKKPDCPNCDKPFLMECPECGMGVEPKEEEPGLYFYKCKHCKNSKEYAIFYNECKSEFEVIEIIPESRNN